MSNGDLGDRIVLLGFDVWLDILFHLSISTLLLSGGLFLPLLPLSPHVELDALSDGKFARALADLGQIGTRETVGSLGKEAEVDVRSDRRLLECRLENRDSRGLVGEGDVDELIESSRSKKSRVELIRSVGGSDDEDVLLGADTVHLSLRRREKCQKVSNSLERSRQWEGYLQGSG